MDTNWGLVADNRINKKLDFSEIKSKEDYEKAVKEFLKNTPDRYGNYRGRNILKAQKRTADDIIEEMYEESKAKEIIEKKQEEELEALRKAQKLHMRRAKRKRLADERKTAKDTRKATKRTVRIWRRRKYRGIDIRGVDTAKRIRLSRKNLITRGDLRLKNIIVGIDKRGIKHYRDPKTGRFVRNPFRKPRKTKKIITR